MERSILWCRSQHCRNWEEFHQINDHSIELAAVWFHHSLGGRPCPVVPILCGSFQEFVVGDAEIGGDESIDNALSYLKEAITGRKTLVLAGADLAHVGPVFGDRLPVDLAWRPRLGVQDNESISAICEGDANGFLDLSRSEGDARRMCGLAPIYMALRLLGRTNGEAVGYEQCPADVDGSSLVSIVGVLLYEDA